MRSFFVYVVIFLVFCVLNFLFNIFWKVVEIKLAKKGTQEKIDIIYANLVKKALSIKDDLKEVKNDL